MTKYMKIPDAQGSWKNEVKSMEKQLKMNL